MSSNYLCSAALSDIIRVILTSLNKFSRQVMIKDLPLRGILIFFHCPANTGYAIASLEKVFFKMAEALVGDWGRIHFAYPSLANGLPNTLPEGFSQVIEFDPVDPGYGYRIERYVRQHSIDTAFGFDQPVSQPIFRYMRRGGIRYFVTYWGAPMSSLNRGFKLWLKRIQVAFSRYGPDYYIFESKGMADTAVFGRGVPATRTSVVYLGVDTSRFRPDAAAPDYVHEVFGIPRDRRVFFYSGHMQKRKGVDVLIRAARELLESHGRSDFQLLILGNRNGEEQVFLPFINGKTVQDHIIFGGYRNDIDQLLPGCYAGLIGSTGWDSFTMSSLEMAASGLPLLVSDLPGLNETVQKGKTGFVFPPGDFCRLAEHMVWLLDEPMLRDRLSTAARARVMNHFNLDYQLQELIRVMHESVRT